MCGNNNECSCSFIKTLELILTLQQKGEVCDVNNGCSKPFLGPILNSVCLNTRPITLYSCCTHALWSMPYTLNGTQGNSTVFRIENLDDNCATFRVLVANADSTTEPYLSTNSFFTMNLNCCCAIRCLNDCFVDNICNN